MLKKIILAATVFVVVVLFFEFTLRQMGFSARLPVGRLPRHYLKADPELGHDIQENFQPVDHYVSNVDFKIWGNELGCYDKPYQGEERPIILVGDSFAHQYGPYEHKWGTVLEEQLRYRILKCGVMGTGTKHQLEKAKRIIAKTNQQPSLIIISYLVSNDVKDDFLFPRYDVVDGYFVDKGKTVNASLSQRTKWWLHENSVIYKTLRDNIKSYYNDFKKSKAEKEKEKEPINDLGSFYGFGPSDNFEAIWNRHLDNMREIKKLAESNNARLLIVLIPDEQLAYDYLFSDPYAESVKNFLDDRHRAYKNFLEIESIPYVDLLPNFKKYAYTNKVDNTTSENKLFWPQDVHFSINGEMLAGLTVAEYIAQNNILANIDDGTLLREVEMKMKDNFPEVFK